MRTIKFRGRVYNTGKLVYGDLTQSYDQTLIWNWQDGSHIVTPESVAQLVGVDRNGNEVYEGDKLVNPRDGTTFKAAMNHIYTVKSYTLKD